MPLWSALQPIRRRLPLLISLLLGIAVAALAWAAYRQMVAVLRAAGEQRAIHATERFASTLGASAERLKSESMRVAGDTSIVAALDRPDSAVRAGVRSRLEQIVEQAPQIAALELLDDTGGTVLWAGERPVDYPAADGLTIDQVSDSAQPLIGRIWMEADPPRYRVVTPVIAGGRTRGYFVQHRLLSTAQGFDIIKGLIGTDASLLLGNATGTGWTNLERTVSGPDDRPDSGQTVYYTNDAGETMLGAVTPVGETPWLGVVSEPERVVLGPARDHLRNMIPLAILIVALGTLAAWLLSRQITAPLVQISSAADALAKGDLARRVRVEREDELGSLAKSFNSMAEQVAEFTHQLEARVEERTDELRKTQATLVQRERLAILGQLAGSVGHELRNPLGVMTNAVYYLQAVLADEPESVHEYLGILRTQIGLSEKIIADLLDYARVKQPQREHVNVARLAQEQMDRLSSHDGVRVVTDFPPDLRDAYVDRVQVGQIVLNLLTNAVQSMPEHGGTLTLRGRGLSDDWVVLDVEDTGHGIPAEEHEKVFEPLFTTKARGIGLGLAVSRGLAQANGGTLSLISKIGHGTTFSLRLPTRPEALD